MLNVKAEGFSVRADLVCESASGQMVKLTANGRNEINLKQVFTHCISMNTQLFGHLLS